jgi:hypothetical protein
VQFVYDVGGTHGPPLPQGAEWGRSAGRDTFLMMPGKRRFPGGAKCGVAIELIDNYGSGLAGTAAVLHRTDGSFLTRDTDAARFRVKINRQLDRLGRFTTLAHELGHIYCGHLGGYVRDRWADRSGELTIGQRELEAEAVSWLVCRRLGLETRSAEYLAG